MRNSQNFVPQKQGPGWNLSGYNSTSSNKEWNLHIFFKDCFLKNLQALYQSSKVQYKTFHGKKFSSNFFDFLYLAWHSRYKSTIENNFSHLWKKLVAAEHTMFKFDDLKVNFQDDRMTTKVLSSRPHIECGETNNLIYSKIFIRCAMSSRKSILYIETTLDLHVYFVQNNKWKLHMTTLKIFFYKVYC